MKILVIEDDKQIADFILEGLTELGYLVTQTNDGQEGLQLAIQQEFELIILDLMLPNVDGMTILKRIRGEGHQVPILILSARHTVQEKVLGLQSGADDYLSKPFAFAELAARSEILMRRTSSQKNTELLTYHDLSLNLISRKLYRQGQEIKLSQREFKLINLFLQQPERVFSKTIILENVWGYQFDPQTNVVDVLVCRLRANVDKGFNLPLIHTIRGVGYVLRNNS